MRGRPLRGRIGICARCHGDQRGIVARFLCTDCYRTVQESHQLDQWPLMGHGKRAVVPLPPLDPNTPAAPGLLSCGWCDTPLTRSREIAGEPLYEVYSVAGAFVAVCFENCPTAVLELMEVA